MWRAELAAKSLWRTVYPVDLSAAAASLGVEIIKWSPTEPRLLGALIRRPGAAFVNGALVPSRARFTAAHELGHFVLGHAGDYYCYDGLRTAQEREANVFAAALLMPEAVVKSLWLKLGNLTPHVKIAVAAKRLAVSRQALGYRLGALGLVAARLFYRRYA